MSPFDDCDVEVRTQFSLAGLTTYKVGGVASWFAEPDYAEEVACLVEKATAGDIEWLVLGRGSNVIVADSGYQGLVIRLGGGFSRVDFLPNGSIEAGAAVPLPKLARAAAKEGRGGLEFLIAVPGSVGGAVAMNAGCHGSEVGEWLQMVQTFRPREGCVTIERRNINMGYRRTSLPGSDVVLSATFATEPRSTADSDEIMRSITRWRREHQPGGTLNAGSVFKNPPVVSAGRLIDSLDLKGHQVGRARVSPRHANFFEADVDATAQDVHDLVTDVTRRVKDATGIVLEPEVRFIGDFTSMVSPC